MYGVPRLQRVSIDDSRKSVGTSLKNREKANSVNSSIQLDQANPMQGQQTNVPNVKKTSISNLSFVPPPFSSSQSSPPLPPPPPPLVLTAQQQKSSNNQVNSSSIYSRAVSYPRQQPFPTPLRDDIHPQQVSPGGENDNFQETVYVSPTDNQIELFAVNGSVAVSTKRRSSNGQGNIENSNLLY